VFFRDDGLSDLIGFKYSDWHADDAVADFVQHLENIASFFARRRRHVVSVILDGENAWEYYPANGHYFWMRSMRRCPPPHAESQHLCRDGRARTGQADEAAGRRQLVYGSFSTWIGSEDKTAAGTIWSPPSRLTTAWWRRQTERRPAGAGNPSACRMRRLRLVLVVRRLQPVGQRQRLRAAVSDQLRELYRMLGVAPPAMLDVPVSSGAAWRKTPAPCAGIRDASGKTSFATIADSPGFPG